MLKAISTKLFGASSSSSSSSSFIRSISTIANKSLASTLISNSFSTSSFVASNVQKNEKDLRIELAAAYRLFEIFGWTDWIYNHLTVRVPGGKDDNPHFLINPFGLLWEEVTASSLVKIDLKGNIIDAGNTGLGINEAGFVIHSAIHEARHDLHCIMHAHSNEGVAVSCMKEGLVMMCQNSMIFGQVSYHDYEGIAVREDEKSRIVSDLGPTNRCLILNNHGLLTAGTTIPEAFARYYNLQKACEIQVMAASMSGYSIRPVEDEIIHKNEELHAALAGEGFGELEFRALVRRLDRLNPGYDE